MLNLPHSASQLVSKLEEFALIEMEYQYRSVQSSEVLYASKMTQFLVLLVELMRVLS